MAAAFLLALPVQGGTPVVNATLDPVRISVGESARLTISRLGTSLESVKLPVVPGLEFRIIERSERPEVIHGASLAATILVVRVTPQVPGTFIIPALTPRSQPLVLRVDPDNGAGPLRGPGGAVAGAPGAAPAGTGEPGAAGVQMTANGSAFLRLSGPKGEIYVGESVPISIELGLRAGVVTSVNGLPAVTGGDFTLLNLSRQPARSERIIDGKPFVLLTWRSVLAAIKPGAFALAVETPLTVRVTARPLRESLLEDQLGDPFLQNFYGATVPKDVTIRSPTYQLRAMALPADGRPAGFSGAVGTFEISSDVSPATAAAGDPLTLRMRVSGSGNFDRVDSAMLAHLDQWKTYPPKSSFHARDAIGFQGEKVFEQPVIASNAGAQTLPGLTFSYFDPSTGRYQTARSAPLRVVISPSAADAALAAVPAAANGSANPASASLGGLRPDHVAAPRFVASLVPPYLQPRFLTIPPLLGLLFAGGWLMIRRSASDPDARPGGRALSRAAARALGRMQAAARAGDTASFLAEAREALLMAGPVMAGPAEATAQRAQGREGGPQYGPDREEIRQLFALADEAKYSGAAPGAVDFARWTQIVRSRLQSEGTR